jgi:hypothetical protein
VIIFILCSYFGCGPRQILSRPQRAVRCRGICSRTSHPPFQLMAKCKSELIFGLPSDYLLRRRFNRCRREAGDLRRLLHRLRIAIRQSADRRVLDVCAALRHQHESDPLLFSFRGEGRVIHDYDGSNVRALEGSGRSPSRTMSSADRHSPVFRSTCSSRVLPRFAISIKPIIPLSVSG